MPPITNGIAIVHNGIIENHDELRAESKRQGYEFTSETDTEVIAHRIHHHLKATSDLFKAVRATVAELEGAYALAVVSQHEPDRIVIAPQGCPAVVGLGEHENFVASDVAALLPVTRNFIFLEEGDVGEIRRNSVRILDKDGNAAQRPAKLSELVGRRLERADDGTPLLDHQLLRLYRAIPDPQWRLAVGLAGVFGLRPVEIGCCRAEGAALRVLGVKRNASGKSADRLVQPLDPQGASGMGAELLALLAERGQAALPEPSERTPWSTRLGDYLDGQVPEWAELRAEADAAHQGWLVPYSLRHGFAWRGSQLYGLSPRVMAQLCGHSLGIHVKHYGAWASEQEVAAAVSAAAARVKQSPALAG